jgi:hypothetical protein
MEDEFINKEWRLDKKKGPTRIRTWVAGNLHLSESRVINPYTTGPSLTSGIWRYKCFGGKFPPHEEIVQLPLVQLPRALSSPHEAKYRYIHRLNFLPLRFMPFPFLFTVLLSPLAFPPLFLFFFIDNISEMWIEAIVLGLLVR